MKRGFWNGPDHELWSIMHKHVSVASKLFHLPRNSETWNAHQSGRINWGISVFNDFFTILISTSGEGVLILTNIRPRIDGHWMASQIDLLKSGFQQVWFYLEFNALHLKLSESNNYFQFTLDFKLYTRIWFLEICIFRWSGNWLLAELSLNWKHL